MSYENLCVVDPQVRDSKLLLISVNTQKVPRTVKFINKSSFSSMNWLVSKYKITINSWHRSEGCRARTWPRRLINHPAHDINMRQRSDTHEDLLQETTSYVSSRQPYNAQNRPQNEFGV